MKTLVKKSRYLKEIENRGFMVTMRTGYAGNPARTDREAAAKLIESRRGLRLYVLEGFRKYSRNCVYFQRFVYLSGVDRGIYWAIRCPSTVKNIAQALIWTTPAEAVNAKKERRRVFRQGDVFIIEKKTGQDNLRNLPESHVWDSKSRTLSHSSHRAVSIPFPFKVVMGKSVRSEAD